MQDENQIQKDLVYIKTLLSEKFGEQGIICQILSQLKKLNGRIKENEDDISVLKKHLYLGIGALGVIGFLLQFLM